MCRILKKFQLIIGVLQVLYVTPVHEEYLIRYVWNRQQTNPTSKILAPPSFSIQ